MKKKTFINSLFIIFSLIAASDGYAQLYSGGPWRGRVIDADTKEPIEGAVVAAVWQRRYDCGFSRPPFFQEAREVLTDKEGRFEISAYTESRGKLFWRAQDHLDDPKSMLICTGPEIEEPNFIIYKPSYGNYPHQRQLLIYPIGPGASAVEYYEEHKEIYKDKLVTAWAKKKTKTLPEGIIYYGVKCKANIDELKKVGSFPFDFGSLFIATEKSKEKIEKLNIPLDCPVDGEPIPASMHGFKDDTINPLHKGGGYIIIELPKLKTKEERREARPSTPSEVSPDKLPLLYKLLTDEDEYIRSSENRGKQQ